MYDREIETLGPAPLRQLQDQKLPRLMEAASGSAFHAEKARGAGLSLSRVRDVETLRELPFTTKADLVREQGAHPPFGRIPAFPMSRYRYLHQTSGTSGSPLRWLDTDEDWEGWLRCWSYVYRGAGVTEGDVVYCAFSFGPYVAHWASMAGARRVGALGLSGGGLTSEQRLRAIVDNRVTVVVCTPTYALHLAEVARDRGFDLCSSAVRVTINAGEPGASVPKVRERIEEAWGARCFDHAGATEVGAWAFDCEARTGGIHLNEAEFVFEVIDPPTARAVGDGERGELVVTNLGRSGMPVVRYRTGDLVERVSEPCPCGRTFARIRGGVLGRADDMIVVRGVNLYPSAVDNIVRAIPEIQEYEVEIRRVAGLDELRLKVETAAARPFADVSRALSDAFRMQLNIRVEIASAPAGSLPRYELKAKRYRRVGA